MSEMVERVARAIDPMNWADIDRLSKQKSDPDWVEVTKRMSMKRANDAITAMREPTTLMFGMAYKHADCGTAHAREVWHAMIDAVLKDPP